MRNGNITLKLSFVDDTIVYVEHLIEFVEKIMRIKGI